ncbi:MAG TPA: ABC transporter permease [Vicinamibacterales bacterium]|nr:ABC transporter permease [Vicinamibacterales bacterium]
MIRVYRLLVRLLLPGVAARHADDMAETAARLAADARAAGSVALARYWLSEWRALARLAWSERSPRTAGFMPSHLARDVRYSLRLLVRTPGVSGVALLTIALGIGANTAIFSIINGVLLRPLPLADPDRLLVVQHASMSDRTQLGSLSPGNFFDVQRASRLLQPMAGCSGATVTLTGRGDPERLQGIVSSGSVLEVTGVQPAIGRIFTGADQTAGSPRVAVISHRLWQRLFAGSKDALGQALTLGGVPVTVIGVMPAAFAFPDPTVDFWAPELLTPPQRASRTEYYLTILGRLAPGATAGAARAELDTIMAGLRSAFPQANGGVVLEATPLSEALVSDVTQLLWVLMASVGCVLLIACANLANLLLAKAAGRGREIAIRQAIGADRGRVIRQLLVESLVLGLAGGAAGIAIGSVFLDALVAWLPAGIPRIAEASIDLRVLLFTVVVSVATGLVFGITPAVQLARKAPASALREDPRTATGRGPLRAVLVAAELALALVLLAGAGLLIRSFALMQRVDPGFSTDRLLTFQVRMEGPSYAQAPARIAFVNAVVERLKTLPGVIDAAAGSNAPIAGRGTGAWLNILARPWPAGTTPPGVPYRVITPGYFKAMQIPLLRGRLLTESDGLTGTPSVVISESVARRFWGPDAGDPIGAEIYMGAPDNKLFERATIVGIVKDVKLAGLGSPLTDAVYGLNTLMPWWRSFTFAVRTSGDPAALAPAARQIVRTADPRLAITALQAMTDIVNTSLAPARASMRLLTLFAAVAVLMAAVGVFGVMSYTVNLRAREMGIRMALGARPSEVRRMVVVDGMRHALIGVALGVGGAVWVTRAMASLLYEVKPGDPATLAAAAGLLIVTAAIACYLPARRATRVDPLIVLRTE